MRWMSKVAGAAVLGIVLGTAALAAVPADEEL